MGIQVGNNTQIPVYTNNNVKFKQNFNLSPAEHQSEDKFEKSGISNKKKGIIAAGIATAAVIIGVLVNKHIKAQQLKKVPEEFKTIFRELKNETGDNFVNKAYDKLKKYMKLEGIAPEKIGRAGADQGFYAVQGGFDPSLNTIKYTDGFFTKLHRASQFELLAHELKHAEQTSKIIRSGKLDEYAQVWAEHNVKKAIEDPLNVTFKTAYKNAQSKGQEKEFTEQVIQAYKENISDKLKKNHQGSLLMPQFKPGSQEYQDAERYLEATRNYEGLGFMAMPGENYLNNPLETEAYGFGAQMKKFFNIVMG